MSGAHQREGEDDGGKQADNRDSNTYSSETAPKIVTGFAIRRQRISSKPMLNITGLSCIVFSRCLHSGQALLVGLTCVNSRVNGASFHRLGASVVGPRRRSNSWSMSCSRRGKPWRSQSLGIPLSKEVWPTPKLT